MADPGARDENRKRSNPAWLFAAGFLLYGYCLSFGFNYLDDTVLLVYQDFLRDISNIAEIFRRDAMFSADGAALYYRPLPNLLLMLEALAGGASPFVYRLTNLLLHLLASFLVFKALVRMRYPERTALFFSFVFLAHPAAAQAVCWIPGSNASLLAVFALAAFIAAADFRESGRPRSAAAHAFFFTCAMFTKESAVALAPLCLLYWRLGQGGKPLRSGLPLWAGWVLGFAVWVLFRSLALPASAGVEAGEMLRSFFANLPVLASGLGNVLLPVNIQVMAVPRDAGVLFGLAAVFLAAWLVFRSKGRRTGYVVFGVSWFLLFFVPGMLSPMPAASNFMPHRLYLPLFGLLIVALEACRSPDDKLEAPVWLTGGILAVLAALTFAQTLHYRDRMSFWQRAASDSPNSVLANVGFGVALGEAGQAAAAEESYRKALALNPADVNANYNFAALLDNNGRREEAVEYYRRALRVSPGFAEGHYRLGCALAALGKLDEAVNHYREALRLKPAYPEAEHNLGVALTARGKLPEAEEHYREALRLKPDFAEARYNLGTLLVARGETGEAVQNYIEALRLKPDFPEAHVNLGYILFALGRRAEAEGHYQEALRLAPGYAAAHISWGTALRSAGDPEGAAVHFREAQRLGSGSAGAGTKK
ncbi:MAG TPA: hypothetical protein DCZ92_09830 [Elusimicrobia bacterium]|nr:MAG: hypothetical protein A2016_05350 [Elusimicrobia bacterium GWF2_62_30]HBA61099.1 hypothetical protein [Elusimicrobiota bacterium]